MPQSKTDLEVSESVSLTRASALPARGDFTGHIRAKIRDLWARRVSRKVPAAGRSSRKVMAQGRIIALPIDGLLPQSIVEGVFG